MKTLQWQNLLGQARIKDVIGTAFNQKTLGHAYLFCGDQGVGTFQAALELAMGLLCDSDGSVPCYSCASCRKISHFSHPDLNVVVPVHLEKEHKGSDNNLNERGWAFITESISTMIQTPYAPRHITGVPTMPVECIRELTHAIQRGAVLGGAQVAIMCDVDIMNKEAANALLKTLEEPPENTILLLLSARPHNVLPTIASRCQVVRFGYIANDEIKARLKGNGLDSIDDQTLERITETSQGSLGKALTLIADQDDDMMGQTLDFWKIIESGDWLQITAEIDTFLSRGDYAALEKFFINSTYIIRNSYFRYVGGTEKYFDSGTAFFSDRLGQLPIDHIEQLVGICEKSLRALRARGNTNLLMAHFVLSIVEIVNGKKQQIS